MAIGSLKKANVKNTGNAESVAYVTPKGQWLTVNDDAYTAEVSNTLLKPMTIANSTFHAVQIPPNVNKILVRMLWPLSGLDPTSVPNIRAFGIYTDGQPISVMGTDGTGLQFVKLNVVTWVATDLSLSIGTTTSCQDTVWMYSEVASITGYNILGADYLGVMSTLAPDSLGPFKVMVLFL